MTFKTTDTHGDYTWSEGFDPTLIKYIKTKNMEHRMRLIIELISVGAIVASLIFLGIEAK